jgi:CRISPR-associated Csx2 family protein
LNFEHRGTAHGGSGKRDHRVLVITQIKRRKSMSHILITFLGRGEKDGELYPTERYHFEGDDTPYYETNFFGLAVLDHLTKKGSKPDKLVVLGTNGSMWDAFFQLPDDLDSKYEDDYFELAEIIENNAQYSEQQDVTPYLETAKTVFQEHLDNAVDCELRVIPYGETQDEQIAVLKEMVNFVTEKDTISLDITHGLRHLPMLTVFSAMYLEVLKKVTIAGIYYGASEMKHLHDDVVPAVNLGGLLQIAKWVGALNAFDKDGDYAVFADLLETEGLPTRQTKHLKDAAFFERICNVPQTAKKLTAFRKDMPKDFPGISRLFGDTLKARTYWATTGNLYERQRQLAYSFLDKKDYFRAAIFGIQAFITNRMMSEGYSQEDIGKYYKREPVSKDLDGISDSNERAAFELLKKLWNTMTSSHVPRGKVGQIMADNNPQQRFEQELRQLMDNLLFNKKDNKKDDAAFDDWLKSDKSFTRQREAETLLKSAIKGDYAAFDDLLKSDKSLATREKDAETQFKSGLDRYKRKEYKQAIDWFHRTADQKHAGAQFYLAEAYFYGRGVTLSYDKALEWYQKAAKQGNSNAQKKWEYGYSKMEQLTTTQEYVKAVEWSALANQGDIEAKYQLGVAFYNGDGVVKNVARTVELWEEAAERGYSKAQFRLGRVFYRQKDKGKIYLNKALNLWHQAAEHKNAEALFHLGVAYFPEESGIADKKKAQAHSNFENAVKYWHEAAELGHIEAQYHLANAYYQGKGTEINKEEAIKWWQTAGTQGHITAQYNLGITYLKGLGMAEKNENKAMRWFQNVAEHPDKTNPLVILAQYQLGILYKNVPNYQDAKDSLRLAATSSSVEKGVNTIPEDKNFLKKVMFDGEKIGESFIVGVRQSAQQALEDIIKLEEQKEGKKELEDVMAMFAHKFRGPLRSLQYDVEHNLDKETTLEAVQIMAGLLNIFSIISTDAQTLREKWHQDRQGHATLLTVVKKSLSLAIEQLLSIDNIDKISHHYLSYAKKTGQVPATTTRNQWEDEYLTLEKQLQASWLYEFKQLDHSDLQTITVWVAERFFPLELTGFDDKRICFEHYKAKESTLLIVMTEMLLNAIKYYSSKTNQALKLSWQRGQDFCCLVCENPSTREERDIDKGSYKGHKFLNLIAQKLNGQFPKPVPKNLYHVEWRVPTHLLIAEAL